MKYFKSMFARYGVFVVSGVVVAIVIALTFIVSVTLPPEDGLVQGEMQNAEQFSLFPFQLALEFYYVEHQGYPESLAELSLNDQSLTPAERAELGSLAYEVTVDGSMYTLCRASYESYEPTCVSRGSEPELKNDILVEQL
jgi:TfoX/Sxy family transcriptional regulator of competence genes